MAIYQLIQTVNPAVQTGNITIAPARTKTGSLLLIFMGSNLFTEPISTVTDNAGNTWQAAYGVNGTECWYARNASPTTSITATVGGSTVIHSWYVREYGGMDPSTAILEFSGTTGGGAGASVDTGAITANRHFPDLIVCSCTNTGTSPTLSVGAGYGNFSSQTISATATHGIEDKTVTSSATQNGIMTAGGTGLTWEVGAAEFVIADPKIPFKNYLKPYPFSPGIAR